MKKTVYVFTAVLGLSMGMLFSHPSLAVSPVILEKIEEIAEEVAQLKNSAALAEGVERANLLRQAAAKESLIQSHLLDDAFTSEFNRINSGDAIARLAQQNEDYNLLIANNKPLYSGKDIIAKPKDLKVLVEKNEKAINALEAKKVALPSHEQISAWSKQLLEAKSPGERAVIYKRISNKIPYPASIDYIIKDTEGVLAKGADPRPAPMSPFAAKDSKVVHDPSALEKILVELAVPEKNIAGSVGEGVTHFPTRDAAIAAYKSKIQWQLKALMNGSLSKGSSHYPVGLTSSQLQEGRMGIYVEILKNNPELSPQKAEALIDQAEAILTDSSKLKGEAEMDTNLLKLHQMGE